MCSTDLYLSTRALRSGVNTCLFGITPPPYSAVTKARVHQRSPIIPPMNNTPSECLELYKTRISSSLSVVSGSPCLSSFQRAGFSTETHGHMQKQERFVFLLPSQPPGALISSNITPFSPRSAYILNSGRGSCDNARGIFIPVDHQRCLDSMTSPSQEFQQQLPKLLKFAARAEAQEAFTRQPAGKDGRVPPSASALY